jgi:hypothetical protein
MKIPGKEEVSCGQSNVIDLMSNIADTQIILPPLYFIVKKY